MSKTRERMKKSLSLRVQEGLHISQVHYDNVKKEAIRRGDLYMKEGNIFKILIEVYYEFY
jgi:hypothetical protein